MWIMSEARKRRRVRIVELVAHNHVANQEQLQELLRDEGIEATQATISRDLRDLGITKGPSGYVRIAIDQLSDDDMRQLRDVLQSHVESITPAATLLVVRTASGRASDLAARLERAKIPQCIGVIVGQDTVFVATRSVGQAAELGRMLQHLMRYDASGSA